jgi:hypothetical protein
MKIYHYNSETKEFIGESEAKIDPMATKRIGSPVYLTPANSTIIQPPKIEKGKSIIFDNEWKTIDDHRGEIYYKKDSGQEIEIKELGEEKNELFTPIKYPGNNYKWNGVDWELDIEKETIEQNKKQKYENNIKIINKLEGELSKSNNFDDLKKIVLDIVSVLKNTYV